MVGRSATGRRARGQERVMTEERAKGAARDWIKEEGSAEGLAEKRISPPLHLETVAGGPILLVN